MADFVFFYGTLMTGFDRRRRLGIDGKIRYRGRGWIQAALFDLGLYPAAIPADDGRVWGEVFETTEIMSVLEALDDIEGYLPAEPDSSLYIRKQVHAMLPDGAAVHAWVYFYNAPLGRAPQITSGDYREYLKSGNS
jgi:gamma-glutamylcyclotransferase (GGCT)/AIG2-like uncharacterized protein YtfP